MFPRHQVGSIVSPLAEQIGGFMLSYIYKRYKVDHQDIAGTMVLRVDLLHRSEWPENLMSIQKELDKGLTTIEIRDVLTQESYFCPYDLILQQFPDLNKNDYAASGVSIWNAKGSSTKDLENSLHQRAASSHK
jgi:hypothetical protein